MKRIAKMIAAAVIAPALVVAVLVVGLLAWGFTQFPSDTSAPDPSNIPPVVLDGFTRHLDSNRDRYAARLFLYRDDHVFSQLAFNVAGVTAQLWVSTLWSPTDRVAEVAQQAYFGHGFKGVESAAQGYFGHPARLLSSEQVAALALLTSAPSRFSPWCRRESFYQRAERLPSFAEIDQSRMLQDLLPPPKGACEPAA